MPRAIPLPPPDLNDPTLVSLTVREVAVLLRTGENAARDLIADGTLPAIRIGRSIRIPAKAVRDLLNGGGS